MSSAKLLQDLEVNFQNSSLGGTKQPIFFLIKQILGMTQKRFQKRIKNSGIQIWDKQWIWKMFYSGTKIAVEHKIIFDLFDVF